MRLLLFLIVGSFLPLTVLGIFEDQAGKFDWRRQLIGCPTNVIFDRVQKGSDRILVSTEDDVISAVSANTGEIAWRRILKPKSNPTSASVKFTTDEENLYTISDEGTMARAWRKSDGLLIWQVAIDEQVSEIADIAQIGKIVIATNQRKIVTISKSNEKLISSMKFESEAGFSKLVTVDGEVYHIYASKTRVEIRKIDENGEIEARKSVEALNFNAEKQNEQIGRYLGYWHSDSLYLIDLKSGIIVEKNTGISIRQIEGTTKVIGVKGPTEVKLYRIKDGGVLEEIEKKLETNIERIVRIDDEEHLALISKDKIQIIDTVELKTITAKLPEDVKRVEPRRVKISTATEGKEFEIVYIGEDCKVEMITMDASREKTNWEWGREEALMRVAAVEMVDLPLSESQQLIEDEFEEEGESNIVSAFIRRVVVQVGQLQRWVVRTLQQIFTLTTTLSKRGNGISDFINAMRTSSPAVSKNGPFERDYFNLRKVIIVSTYEGVIFGLDSIGGDVLWKLYLGNNFAPLKSSTGKEEVPIFVQRTTAHYQLNGLAAVVYADRGNLGVIVRFNPINGEVVTKEVLETSIKRVSLLPLTDKNHIQPLVIIEKTDRIKYSPEVSSDILSTCADVYIMDLDFEKKTVRGQKIELVNRVLTTTWSGNLGLTQNDRIIDVKGKPFNQKVHSQGKVLVNRDVQYKYVNPNLAAIVSLDSQAQHLTIILIDVVSGQIVHTASIGKANGPVHFVHAEHWLAYTYWSEKGRRTELGIIELYEDGEKMSQKEVYDSKIPTNKAPIVMSQSYIYAQGIEAMAVTETEQGLTTKSILMALPCGNIHEVSRRLLDATRPLELTPAMREEMMIGYMPEIAIASEEMINYNQTIHKVRGIKAAPSGLESTSLVLAYGTDLFFTRLAPSGTFDILKDDFDHVLISLVLTGLVVGTYITKRWSRSNALAAQWA